MRMPFLLKRLHDLDDDDYLKAGLRGNPAYCDLRRGDDKDLNVSIIRESLEEKIKSSIEAFLSSQNDDAKPKHLYLYSEHGGAGKSHTQNRMKEYCNKKNIPFVELGEEDWHDGDIPENLSYLMKLVSADKVIAFLECDNPYELYDKLCKVKEAFIIGSGHNPNEELRELIKNFEVLDLEREYQLSKTQLLELLRKTMEKVNISKRNIIEDDALKEISKNLNLPGDILNALGICLAIYTYKAKIGEEYKITVEDARQWSYRNMQIWL
ncbi:MAG: hypothetical protein ACUVWN_16565 [bacterium]